MTRTLQGSLYVGGQISQKVTLTIGGPIAAPSLVSCVMITRGGLSPGQYAVECFRRQTYANRELVIVVDGSAVELLEHVATLNDARIRCVRQTGPKIPLGELRNLAIANALGEYICLWDDDDLSDPERVEVQLAALQASGADACLLHRCTLWWPKRHRLGISRARLWENSTLARKAVLPAFPAIQYCEDTPVIEELSWRSPILGLEAPHLYTYIFHNANSVAGDNFVAHFNHAGKRWLGDDYVARLESLNARLPVRDYLAHLAEPDTLQGGTSLTQAATKEMPLVSIVVRSMGRPELQLALASLAAQHYPSLEVIVVDASGGAHPPLPNLAWRPGHSVRLVGTGQRLSRPRAANVGLDSVTGEWFGFLDDDDTFDAEHVAQLVIAAQGTSNLVVYALSRVLGIDGEVRSVMGLPFNRSSLFYAPLFAFPAALIKRSVLDLGCRFDESMDICEDRDFFAQIATYSDFAHIDLATFNYHVELGTSGTGQGNNRNSVRMQRFVQLLQAKWQGDGAYHGYRAQRFTFRAIESVGRGDSTRARALLEQALREYPDDPNALAYLGHLLSLAGERRSAEVPLKRAIELLPYVGQFRLWLALHLEHVGSLALARKEAWLAASDPTVREAASDLLARLGGPPPKPLAKVERPAQPNVAQLRTKPCPCGSGKRYKHCCGKLTAPATVAAAGDAIARQALAAYQAGEAVAAMRLLADLSPEVLTQGAMALACGDCSRDMQRYDVALSFYRQAELLGEVPRAVDAVGRCCQRWYKPERDGSMRRKIAQLIQRFDVARVVGAPGGARCGPLHIIGDLSTVGESQHRALGYYETLAQSGAVRLWSLVPPLPELAQRYPIETIDISGGRFPGEGHFLFIGIDFGYGHWLEESCPTRITLCVDSDRMDMLIARLVELEEIPEGFAIDLTYPSSWFRNEVGLPGAVEYPLIDTAYPCPRPTVPASAGAMVIGRHSRDSDAEFHANDPAFFRRLISEGYQVRILGGTRLAVALRSDAAGSNVSLLPETATPGGVAKFLDGLDCFVYRIPSHLTDTSGTVVMEAMSAGLPVVLFRQRVGAAELIEHGSNGFLVVTEEQALDCIRRLSHDLSLRHSMGTAARRTIMRLMAVQTGELLDRYGKSARGEEADHMTAAGSVTTQ